MSEKAGSSGQENRPESPHDGPSVESQDSPREKRQKEEATTSPRLTPANPREQLMIAGIRQSVRSWNQHLFGNVQHVFQIDLTDLSGRPMGPGPRYALVTNPDEASPPKLVSFEELMRAANGVTNMTLAHEICVSEDFELTKGKDPNSIHSQVKAVAQKAFWDVMEERLNADPPNVEQIMALMTDLKERVDKLLEHGATKLKPEVDAALDLDLIRQQVEQGVIDVKKYGQFVITLLERLCAPARDEEVAALKEITDTVQLFKEIFTVMEAMQLDMVNFTISSMRPLFQRHSVEYERKKFNEFLQTQQGQGIDGLKITKAWIQQTYEKLQSAPTASKSATETQSTNQPEASDSAANQGPPPAATSNQEEGSSAAIENISPSKLLNSSYLGLLEWPEDQLFPETVLMDQVRFLDLHVKVNWLSLVSSVLLVTYNTVGASISGISGLKEQLKDHMTTILSEVKKTDLEATMPNAAAQVITDVENCLSKHGFPALDALRRDMLQGQIQAVADEGHSLRKLTRGRITAFMLDLISAAKPSTMLVPPGLSVVSNELTQVSGQFLRLVSYNREVFGPLYADIIKKVLGIPTSTEQHGTSE